MLEDPHAGIALPVDAFGCWARMFALPGLSDALVFAFTMEGKLDLARLAEALRRAVTLHHPVASARLERFGGLFYHWRCRPFHAEHYLRGPYRAPRRFDLAHEPPLRVHVADDSLAFEMSHVAFDAIGFARVVRTVLAQYAAFPTLLEPRFDEIAIRRERALFAPRPRGVERNPGRRFVDPIRGAVIARRNDSIVATAGEGGQGTLHHHLTLALAPLRAAAHARGVTLNDWLGAGCLAAFAEWNRRHGARGRFASVDLPANLRPAERASWVAANVTGTLTVNLDLGDGTDAPTFDGVLRAFHDEMARAKAEQRAWSMAPRWPVRDHPTLVSVWLARALTALVARPLVALGPTLLLSNFGALDGLTGTFGDLGLTQLRVEGSAYPIWTVNAVSPADHTLVLSFCVRKSHFSADSLAAFASLTQERILAACKS
ncbi:MAG: hypothetical protein U0610_22940 [bacterium]